MDTFRETAFYVTGWHAFLAILIGVLSIVLDDPDPATAFLIAANVALLFALLLVVRVNGLTQRAIKRGHFWQALPPPNRPATGAGVQMAHRALAETWLRFAKGAAAVAVVLAALAYATHGVSSDAWAEAVQSPAVAQHADGAAAYGSTRLLPMN